MNDKWERKLEEHKLILLCWYERIGEMGHGEITIRFEQSSNKVEIVPMPKIRSVAEHKVISKV